MTIDRLSLSIRENLADVRDRIRSVGGDAQRITIVGVTKKKSAEVVRAAAEAGIRAVGENYAQEMVAKIAAVESDAEAGMRVPRWHFIGRLQRNKVKLLAPHVDVWHTVDSVRLAREIAKHQSGARIFVQVDAAEGSDRGGCTWNDIDSIVEVARDLGLVVQGLMGVGPNEEPARSRPFFRRLVEESRARELVDVSCGMSADYDIAVEEGATVLRLGSVLFGGRERRPDEHAPSGD